MEMGTKSRLRSHHIQISRLSPLSRPSNIMECFESLQRRPYDAPDGKTKNFLASFGILTSLTIHSNIVLFRSL